MARIKKIAKKYRQKYLSLEGQLFHKNSTPTRKFIESIINYANTQNEGFDAVYASKNFINALQYKRLLADACLRAYALLVVDLFNIRQYIDKFFEGKEPSKSRAQGEKLTTGVLSRKISQEYPKVADAYNQGNKSIHLTDFYYQDFSNPLLPSSTNLDTFAGVLAVEEQEHLLQQMHYLNETLIDIICRIIAATYEQYPFTFDPESGIPMVAATLQIHIRVDETGKYGDSWMGVQAVREYIQGLLEQANTMYVQQVNKALALGVDVSTQVNTTLTPIVRELQRCAGYNALIEELIRQKGEEALENYRAKWMTLRFEYVEGVGDTIVGVDLPTRFEDMRIEYDPNVKNKPKTLMEYLEKHPDQIPPDFQPILPNK